MGINSRSWKLSTRSLGSVIALVMVFGSAPTEAVGGCAHYVVSGAKTTDSSGGIELIGGSFDRTPAPVPAQPQELPKPCSGALCSGNPGIPLPSGVSIVAQSGSYDVWGDLKGTLAPRVLASESIPEEESLLYSRIDISSIDRPPRLVFS